MKRCRMLLAVITVVVMITVTCMPVLAASNQLVSLAADQIWTKGYGEAHDPAYLHCGAGCHSVYPYSNTDLYTKIQCKVTNTYNVTIAAAPTYTLRESDTWYTPIPLMDGYLTTSTVYFHFRGNTSAQAQAIVSYVGTLIV